MPKLSATRDPEDCEDTGPMGNADKTETSEIPQTEGPMQPTKANLHNSTNYWLEAVCAGEIHSTLGARVVEHIKPSGTLLVLKGDKKSRLSRSEGEIMHYAATHGILAPKVIGIYDITLLHGRHKTARVFAMERIPGDTLHYGAWGGLSEAERASVKDQLRIQLARMRECTQPFIGCIGRQETRNLFDTFYGTEMCGPFDNEEDFDQWCLERLNGRRVRKWSRVLEKKRRKSSGKFVLTHGNLLPQNIMVQGSTVTGIIGWGGSGFFPEYVEYATAIAFAVGIPEWWLNVLKEVLEPCSKDLVKFTRAIDTQLCGACTVS